MLYSSCFENMPTREKELQGFFFTSVGVSFQNTYTFWESGGMFWGPKIYFPKIQRSSFRLWTHAPHIWSQCLFLFGWDIACNKRTYRESPCCYLRGMKEDMKDSLPRLWMPWLYSYFICTSKSYHWYYRVLDVFNFLYSMQGWIVYFAWDTVHCSGWFYAGGHKEMSSILADTNSALVYEPKCRGLGGGGGLRVLSQWVQLCTWSPNKLWISNSIFSLWFYGCWDSGLGYHINTWKDIKQVHLKIYSGGEELIDCWGADNNLHWL
jgi:hypothetical protein